MSAFTGRRRHAPDPGGPDPSPGPPPADLRGLVLAILAIFADADPRSRVVCAPPDPTDPNYPVTLARVRAALGE